MHIHVTCIYIYHPGIIIAMIIVIIVSIVTVTVLIVLITIHIIIIIIVIIIIVILQNVGVPYSHGLLSPTQWDITSIYI